MTPTDRATLVYLEAYLRTHRTGPKLAEVGARFGGIGPQAVTDRMKRLEKAGLIRREPRKARAVRLTEAGLAVCTRYRMSVCLGHEQPGGTYYARPCLACGEVV